MRWSQANRRSTRSSTAITVPGADSVEGYLQEMTEDADLDTELVSNIGQAESLDDENAPIIRLVTQLIIDAFKMKASDIHLEPMEKRYRVRYRIDGALREVEGPPKYMQANFTSRVKIMARLDITEKRIPQDGRIQVTVGDRDIDLRVFVGARPFTANRSSCVFSINRASSSTCRNSASTPTTSKS